MGRPSREAEILAAALSEFAERGYDAARVREIARRAGLSDAALYSHYASKEALALALFCKHIARYADALEAVAAAGISAEIQVRGIALRSLEVFLEEPDAFAFVMSHQARFIGALPARFPYPIRIVERVIRDGQKDGSVRPGAVRLLAALVFGCVMQPIRTLLEAPPGTISLRSDGAQALIARAAWAAVAGEVAAES